MKRIILLIALLILGTSLYGQIAIDNTLAITGNASGFTQAFTVGTGSNRMLVVSVKNRGTGISVGSLTYDGVALTYVTSTAGTGLTNEIWYLKNPASGAHNLVATLTGTAVYSTGILSYRNVDSIGASGVFFSSSSNYSSVSITTTAPNSVIVGSGFQTTNSTLTFPGGSVTRTASSSSSTPKYSSVMADKPIASAGTANMFMLATSAASTGFTLVELIDAIATSTPTYTHTYTPTPTLTPTPYVWKVFGGSKEDIGYVSYALSSDEFIIAGSSESFGAGLSDAYVIRADVNGDCVWAKTYGGEGLDVFYDASECTITARLAFVGKTTSIDPLGNQQGYLMITDMSGNCITSKTAGGSGTGSSELNGIRHTDAGDYWLIAGATNRNTGGNSTDFMFCKLDSDGNTLICNHYGGVNEDVGEDVLVDNAGYIYVCGYSNSFGAGDYDYYVVKLDPTGTTVIDTATYGVTGMDEYLYTSYYDAIGDDILLTGWQITNDAYGTVKTYGVHIETDLSVTWTRNIGEIGYERYARWAQPYFSTYVSVGSKNNTPSNSYDAGIAQVTDAGSTIYERTYGGTGFDEFWSVSHPNGWIAMVGATDSYSVGGGASDGFKHIYLVLEKDSYIPTATPQPTKTPIPTPPNVLTQIAQKTAVALTATAVYQGTQIVRGTNTVTKTITTTATFTVTPTVTQTITPTSQVGASISITSESSYGILGKVFRWFINWSVRGTTADYRVALNNMHSDYGAVTAVPTWSVYNAGSETYTWLYNGRTAESGTITVTARVDAMYFDVGGPVARWWLTDNQGGSVVSILPIYTATVTKTVTPFMSATITHTLTPIPTETPQSYLANINCGELTAVVTAVSNHYVWSVDAVFTATPGYGRFTQMTPVAITTPIPNTQDMNIYQSYAAQWDNYLMWAAIVPSGEYRVTLKFIDHTATAIGQHTMSAVINGGDEVINIGGIDIYELAGKRKDWAVDISRVVTVSGSALSVYISPSGENKLAFISGITIQKIQ